MIVSASDVINATLDGNVQFNITAEDEDTVNFEVINQPESATKKQSGNVLYFSWNVTSSQKVHNFKQKSAQPAKTSVSPRSSPLGTFRAEERGRFSVRNVPNGEERGETDISAGYWQCFKCVLMLTLINPYGSFSLT